MRIAFDLNENELPQLLCMTPVAYNGWIKATEQQMRSEGANANDVNGEVTKLLETFTNLLKRTSPGNERYRALTEKSTVLYRFSAELKQEYVMQINNQGPQTLNENAPALEHGSRD